MARDTNVVHVSPTSADHAALRAKFEHFGNVAAVSVLVEDSDKVGVTFYDVRSASAAVQAVGGCSFGPQAGSRTVELTGAVPITHADFTRISNISYQDKLDGAYVVEFFDIRDAAALEARAAAGHLVEEAMEMPPVIPQLPDLDVSTDDQEPSCESVGTPPGLEPPPGLEAFALGLSEGADFEDPSVAPTTHGHDDGTSFEVHVCGLPNRLLSDVMLETMLEQAGVDSSVKGFRTVQGQSTGQAFIRFGDYFEASRFTTHVQGVSWGSGTRVTASLGVPQQPQQRKPRQPAALAAAPRPRAPKPALAKPAGEVRSRLRSDAPAYINLGTKLSAAAQVFVPKFGGGDSSFPPQVGALRRGGSDISTALAGDSEGHSDKDLSVGSVAHPVASS